jgi:hypothetical protein
MAALSLYQDLEYEATVRNLEAEIGQRRTRARA